jgi:hypothetical protein
MRQVPWECRPAHNNYEFLCRKIFRKATVLKKLFGLPPSRIISDDGRGWRQEILDIRWGQNVYLDGYWQSEKYFKDAQQAIRKDFSFRGPSDQANRALLEKMDADLHSGFVPVSVHVRRGDYSSNPQTNAFHGLLPVSYYEAAMGELEKRFPRISYYVFSDDLGWCRENMRFKGRVAFVDVNVDKPCWMDMRLMSACRHHIIANSSFSWWGAWLNARQDKAVIAPRQWFADSRFIGKDRLPDGWIEV